MKKLLAMVLALVMTLSLAVSANAAFKDADKVSDTYEEAVAEECALHLIPGIISRNVVVSAFKRSQFKHNTKPPNLFWRAAFAARVVYFSFVPLGTILSIVTPCEQKYIF